MPFAISTTARPEAELSKAHAKSLLDVNTRQINLLLDSGYLPGLRLADVAPLTACPMLHSATPLTLLRAGTPYVSDTGRPVGMSVDYDEPTIVEALRKWWPVNGREQRVATSGHMLIAVGTFVVGLLAITGLDTEDPEADQDDPHGRVLDVSKSGHEFYRYAFKAHLVAHLPAIGEAVVLDNDPGDLEPLIAAMGTRIPPIGGGPVAFM